jgi:hypothetical protein
MDEAYRSSVSRVIKLLKTFHLPVRMRSPLDHTLSQKNTFRTLMRYLFKTHSNTVQSSHLCNVQVTQILLVSQCMKHSNVPSHRHQNMRTILFVYSLSHHANTQDQLLLLGLCNFLRHMGKKLS